MNKNEHSSSFSKSFYLGSRKKFKNLIFVTPGIRLPDDSQDDQKRVETPGTAIKNGANILVIGRSITNSKDPIQSIKKIMDNINYELKNTN